MTVRTASTDAGCPAAVDHAGAEWEIDVPHIGWRMTVRATRTGAGNSAMVSGGGRTKRDPRRRGNGWRVSVRAARTSAENSAVVPDGGRKKWQFRVGREAGSA
ncbi:hypothetical protein Aglo03_51280 [Actinokineospora globicatena]|uniref:Uncharacterized protein n=1 Tax=Actinokineospora globicatena TaxID=103729 RepID=A0A9W6QTI2_9PSEU|nr:hypothetical protein Aglo03_51280 [Actinokineospora globicatena]